MLVPLPYYDFDIIEKSTFNNQRNVHFVYCISPQEIVQYLYRALKSAGLPASEEGRLFDLTLCLSVPVNKNPELKSKDMLCKEPTYPE